MKVVGILFPVTYKILYLSNVNTVLSLPINMILSDLKKDYH